MLIQITSGFSIALLQLKPHTQAEIRNILLKCIQAAVHSITQQTLAFFQQGRDLFYRKRELNAALVYGLKSLEQVKQSLILQSFLKHRRVWNIWERPSYPLNID